MDFDSLLNKIGLQKFRRAGTDKNVYATDPNAVRRDMETPQIKIENPRHLYGFYTNELRDFKPNQLIEYLEWSRKGLNWYKSAFFEEVRRKDLRIGGVCRTRKLSVAKLEWDVKYSKDSTVPEAEQKKKIKFVKDNLKRVNVPAFISDCTEAQIQGVSTFEINYGIYDGLIGLKSVKYIPNHILLYDDLTDSYHYLAPDKNDIFIMRQYTARSYAFDRIDIFQLAAPDPNPFKILEVHSLDGTAQNGFRNGIIDALLFAFLFKSYGIKDWHTFIERFATPAIVGKFDPLMNTQERGTFFEAIKNWGRLFKLIIPNTASIDLLKDQSAGQTSGIFKENQDYWNEEISIGVLGNPLTTNVGRSGSYAAARVAEVVRHDIKVSDMLVVKEAANELIDRLWEINFPKDTEQPEFMFKEEVDTAFQEARAKVIVALRQTGYKVMQEDLETEFNVHLEEAPVAGAAATSGEMGGGNGGQFIDTRTIRGFSQDYIDKYLKKIVREVKK